MESAVIAFSYLIIASLTILTPAADDAVGETAQANRYEATLNAWYMGDLDRARALADELVQGNDLDGMAHALLGLVLDSQGDEESDEHLERALELSGHDVAVLTRVGDVYATRFGAYVNTDLSYLAPEARQQANDLYRRWAEVEPESPLPVQRLAWLEKTAGNGPAAIGMLFAAIAVDPMADAPHGELWSFLGNGVEHEELASFYEGLALTRTDPAARGRCFNYQGQVLIALGKKLHREAPPAGRRGPGAERLNSLADARRLFDRSIPCLLQSAKVDPSLEDAAKWYVADARVRGAELFGEMGDLAAVTGMVDEVREAILARCPPGTEDFRKWVDRLGFAIFNAAGGEGGDIKGMVTLSEFWKWAVEQADDSKEWWNNYAFFCREAEKFAESYAAYSHCLELDPTSVRLMNDTGLIQLYHLGEDLERALLLFEQACELGEAKVAALPEGGRLGAEMLSAYGDALLNLGRIHTLNGHFEQADEAFDRLAALDGERFDLFQSRFELVVATGDPERLREMVHMTALTLLTEPESRGTKYRLAWAHDELVPKEEGAAVEPVHAEVMLLIEKILKPETEVVEDSE